MAKGSLEKLVTYGRALCQVRVAFYTCRKIWLYSLKTDVRLSNILVCQTGRFLNMLWVPPLCAHPEKGSEGVQFWQHF